MAAVGAGREEARAYREHKQKGHRWTGENMAACARLLSAGSTPGPGGFAAHVFEHWRQPGETLACRADH